MVKKLLSNTDLKIIVVEHSDRLMRFGIEYVEALLATQGRKLVIMDSEELNGEKIVAPNPLSKNLKHLRRLSRQHSRKIKGSNNRKKSALKLSRMHRKIRNIRKDFLHKQTTKLAKTKSAIVLEDLGVRIMQNKNKFNRKISDAG